MSDYSGSDTEAVDRYDNDTKQFTGTSDSVRSPPSSIKADGHHYSLSDYYDLTIPLINGKCLQSSNIHSFLRTLLDFSLLHSFQLKALQKREIKLADITLYEFNEDFQALLIRSVLPKTTQIQYTARLRHKLVELCPIFIFSMYLFARFHIPDTYGEYDLTEESLTNEQFLDYKLLNGGNKLRPLSYSQQYKASTRILKISDKYKPIHLGKILTTQYNTNPDLGLVSESPQNYKCSSHTVAGIQLEALCKFAGFENESAYRIDRAKRIPPPFIVEQIFPFLNTHRYGQNSELDEFFRLLNFIRITLVQDMVEVKKRFPENLVCEHPIFSSQEFCDFAGVPKESSVSSNRNDPDSSPTSPYSSSVDLNGEDGNAFKEDDEFRSNSRKRPYMSTSQDGSRKRLRDLEKLVESMRKQQTAMAREMSSFIEKQHAQLAEQGNMLRRLMNSTDGLSILLATRNPNAGMYSKQVYDQNSVTFDQLQRKISQASSDGVAISQSWSSRMQQLGKQSKQYKDKVEEARARALMLIPAPSVDSIKELYDDFAAWSSALADHHITLDEWNAAHKPDDRTLVEMRSAIVRFLENETARSQAPIHVTIAKLQSKLRDQNLSVVLPDLAKQILSGNTVILD
ncbi:hypothetical protein FDK38_000144 [Candidozyma auris]|nr:hypothetical protein FDK38_000144 [[Candida] auris]